MFSRKQLIRELRKADLSEFFTQHLEPIDISSVKISCNLVERLTRYKRKQKVLLFFGTPCICLVRNNFEVLFHGYMDIDANMGALSRIT